MMKKLCIIGRGTAGSLAAAHFLRYTDWEIEWCFDNNIIPQAVGEGAILSLPDALYKCLGFQHHDLSKIDGTFKSSIYKEGWGKGQGFHHTFPPPCLSYHFNANKLQDYILSIVKDNNRFTIKEQNINHNETDSDFILDCSGNPRTYDEFNLSEYIPVNSVHVNQCYWDHPRFQYTLTIARPYGWVFGIPLQNRCSIGYLYNNNINTIDEVKEDIKEIFKQYNLTPSENTNSFSFKNYNRKQNFNKRVAYNGNASFFLEPLEATSIMMILHVNRLSFDLWNGLAEEENINQKYIKCIKQIQNVIMMHYSVGSIWDNNFWKYAKSRGEKSMTETLSDPEFIDILQEGYSKTPKHLEYGSWTTPSFPQNIKGLGINIENHITEIRI